MKIEPKDKNLPENPSDFMPKNWQTESVGIAQSTAAYQKLHDLFQLIDSPQIREVAYLNLCLKIDWHNFKLLKDADTRRKEITKLSKNNDFDSLTKQLSTTTLSRKPPLNPVELQKLFSGLWQTVIKCTELKLKFIDYFNLNTAEDKIKIPLGSVSPPKAHEIGSQEAYTRLDKFFTDIPDLTTRKLCFRRFCLTENTVTAAMGCNVRQQDAAKLMSEVYSNAAFKENLRLFTSTTIPCGYISSHAIENKLAGFQRGASLLWGILSKDPKLTLALEHMHFQ